jgi:hypothetical protein
MSGPVMTLLRQVRFRYAMANRSNCHNDALRMDILRVSSKKSCYGLHKRTSGKNSQDYTFEERCPYRAFHCRTITEMILNKIRWPSLQCSFSSV